jgi:hypothetical protein
LKLRCDELLSSAAFSFNLRRYTVVLGQFRYDIHGPHAMQTFHLDPAAGAHNPPLLTSI